MTEMGENETNIVFKEPDYATDEKTKPGYLIVILGLKGIRTKTSFTFKKLFSKKASNATVESVFGDSSFCVTVMGEKGEIKDKHYQLKIKKLPREIISGNCYHEVEDDRIKVFLQKQEPRSWYPELEDGLETAVDEDGDGEEMEN